jgi:hypothetical protein
MSQQEFRILAYIRLKRYHVDAVSLHISTLIQYCCYQYPIAWHMYLSISENHTSKPYDFILLYLFDVKSLFIVEK